VKETEFAKEASASAFLDTWENSALSSPFIARTTVQVTHMEFAEMINACVVPDLRERTVIRSQSAKTTAPIKESASRESVCVIKVIREMIARKWVLRSQTPLWSKSYLLKVLLPFS
jgi:hypothetical protein